MVYTAVSGKVTESALPLSDSTSALHDHLRNALISHLGTNGSYPDGPYVHDVFPKHVVYRHKGQTFKAGYTTEYGPAGSKPKITIAGGHKKVHMAYMNNADQTTTESSVLLSADESESVCYTENGAFKVTESLELTIPATFKEAKTSPLTVEVCLIKPGMGSMAYYSKEALQKAATDGIFAKGTHMMWNHPTATEEADRPEGDLADLAAVLVENAKWKDGAKGPGLYAKAKVFSDYADAVTEKGPYIGVSINAAVQTHEGTIDGRKVRIADKFVHAYSTDFVTKAGAGGAPVVPVTESANPAHTIKQEVRKMEVDATVLTELRESINKLTEGQAALIKRAEDSDKAREAAEVASNKLRLQTEAKDLVTAGLQEAGITTVKPRLLAAQCAEPVVKEGKVDAEWVKSIVADIVESFGSDGGEVTGMGRQKAKEGNSAYTPEEAKRIMESVGIPAEGAEYALKGGGR